MRVALFVFPNLYEWIPNWCLVFAMGDSKLQCKFICSRETSHLGLWVPTESQCASDACRDEETRLIRDMQGGLAIQAVIQDLQVMISDPQLNQATRQCCT